MTLNELATLSEPHSDLFASYTESQNGSARNIWDKIEEEKQKVIPSPKRPSILIS